MKLFIIYWDLSDLGDEEFLAYIVKFPGYEDTVELILSDEYQLPHPVLFTGNIKKIRTTDYPYTDARWPIMSSKMIAVLRSLNGCNIREFPVRIIDDTLENPKVFFDGKMFNENHVLGNFSAVQLLDFMDTFDWENSIYTKSDYVPNMVDFLDKLVVKQLPAGAPPIFRLSAYPRPILITEDTKNALENAGIKGIEYIAVNDYPKKPF